MAVVAECYVKGVSTRRVDGLIKTLGIDGISKSQVSELAKSLDEHVAAFRTRHPTSVVSSGARPAPRVPLSPGRQYER